MQTYGCIYSHKPILFSEQKYAIQACATLTDVDTLEREVEGLKKFDRLEVLRRMVIVTLDEEDTIALPNGKTIEVLPAWKWLLERGE